MTDEETDPVKLAYIEMRQGELAKEGEAQREIDRLRAQAKHLVETARPDPETLHKAMLANMTTKPRVNLSVLGLSWMQHRPETWDGYSADQCENIARMIGIGEDI